MTNKTNKFLDGNRVINKVLTIGLLAMVLGLFSTIAPVQAKVTETNTAKSSVENTQRRSWRFGPYATHRRAIEVARYARKKGYKAKVVPAGSIIYGSRVYYVNVWR